MRQFEITPKALGKFGPGKNTPEAFANFSPGFEHRENPGDLIPNCDETLKGLCGWRTLFQGSMTI